MIEIKLPSMGEGVEKGVVVTILVAVGDHVQVDQPLLEVETDKVTAEVPCETAGIVAEILVNIGDEIPEGTPIIIMEGNEVFPIEIDIETSIITDTQEPNDTQDLNPNGIADVEELVIVKPAKIQPAKIDLSTNTRKPTGFRASPLARKVAREIGVDIALIEFQNGSSRISVKDVKNYAKKRLEKEDHQDIVLAVALPKFEKWGSIRKEALSPITKATSRNMVQAWTHIPHAWLEEKIDITDLEATRQRHKALIKSKGGSLTITSILVKAVASVLKEMPILNASIDVVAEEVIYKDYVNVGVAVDTDRGLVVPVINDADQLTLTDISQTLTEISKKARDKKLKSTDLEGATFTISNLGGIGTTSIFPIVNFPQVAILGVASSQTTAVWLDNAFEPRLIMPLTLGFDHRLINGADAARFLQRLKSILEDWFTISI